MRKARVPVALEGYPFIFFGCLTTVGMALLSQAALTLAALAATACVLWFFRDPERIGPDVADAIVCPADGRIIAVDKIFDDRFTREHVYKVSIFMNVFNVHVNRIPYPGTVEKISFHPGSFYSASTERGALRNEHCAVIVRTDRERRYAVVQVAGLIARRIVCWLDKGDVVSPGVRFGLIRFGSRVDLYLPLQVQLEVVSGQQVRAGESVLGYFT